MRKYSFPLLIIFVPVVIIFLAFKNPAYTPYVKQTIPIFILLAVPYCLSVRDPRKGLLVFLAYTSLLEGPWKLFTYGTPMKLVVYIIRDLLLYGTFLNFQTRKRKILPQSVWQQKPPFTGIIGLFILNIALQLFNPNGYNLLNSFSGSRLFWEMIPLYWMGFYLMRERKNFIVLAWVSIICVALGAIATIFQFNLGLKAVAKIAEGYHVMCFGWGRAFKGILRPPGLGSDMGFTGFLFNAAVPMFIVLFANIVLKKQNRTAILHQIYLLILAFFSIAGLIFSVSRGAVVQSIVHMGLCLWIMKGSLNKVFVRLILAISIIYLVIPYVYTKVEMAQERYESIRSPKILLNTVFKEEQARYLQAVWWPLNYSVTMFMGNGLGRVGPGAALFSDAPPAKTNAENLLCLGITEIGTIGILLWIFLHIQLVRSGAVNFKKIKNQEMRWCALIPISSMFLYLTNWQFGQLIAFPSNAGFWFMAGTLMGLKYIEE